MVCRDPGGAIYTGTRTASATGVTALSESFFRSSSSWLSEGLFGQPFSIALPIQAHRGLPYLGSFSVVWYIRHIEGPPWLGSYSVDQCISHLKEHPGWALLCDLVHQAFDGPASFVRFIHSSVYGHLGCFHLHHFHLVL